MLHILGAAIADLLAAAVRRHHSARTANWHPRDDPDPPAIPDRVPAPTPAGIRIRAVITEVVIAAVVLTAEAAATHRKR